MFGGLFMKFILTTIIEFAVGGFIIWGFWHEDKVTACERRIFAAIRRKKLKVIKGGGAGNTKKHCV